MTLGVTDGVAALAPATSSRGSRLAVLAAGVGVIAWVAAGAAASVAAGAGEAT